MRRPVIAGNWKMYKTVQESLDFAAAIKPLVVGVTHCDIVVAPPFTTIKPIADRLEGSNVAVAGQNVAAEEGPGAFTGEISAAMLRDAGARYVIIGHSERRLYYSETDNGVNRKVGVALKAGLIPIVCCGERLEARDAGDAEAVVTQQIAAGLQNLTLPEASRIIVAYEPVWAIGTGRTATPEIAQQMHSLIRSLLRKAFGNDVADSIPILYGGSVKPDNVAGLMAEADVDGALVGGASLEPASFAGIVNYKSN
jgi:triosephosphate isomerase